MSTHTLIEQAQAHGYIHYGNAWNDRVVKGGHLFTPDCPCDDFHEYAVEKKPGEISFFFDGHKYQTFTECTWECDPGASPFAPIRMRYSNPKSFTRVCYRNVQPW